jgi:hypothetical protein
MSSPPLIRFMPRHAANGMATCCALLIAAWTVLAGTGAMTFGAVSMGIAATGPGED